jgi:hypothetical protein
MSSHVGPNVISPQAHLSDCIIIYTRVKGHTTNSKHRAFVRYPSVVCMSLYKTARRQMVSQWVRNTIAMCSSHRAPWSPTLILHMKTPLESGKFVEITPGSGCSLDLYT